MDKEPKSNRFTYEDDDQLEIFDLDELEIASPKKKKPVVASAILAFEITTDEKE